MDALSTLLFGWIFFATAVFFISNYLHGRWKIPIKQEEEEVETTIEIKAGEVSEPTPEKVAEPTPEKEVPIKAEIVVPVKVEKVEAVVIEEVTEASQDSNGAEYTDAKDVLLPPKLKPRKRVKEPSPVKKEEVVSEVVEKSVADWVSSGGVKAAPKPAEGCPIASGPDLESVKWVNNVFQWVYTTKGPALDMFRAWMKAISEKTKSSPEVSERLMCELKKYKHPSTMGKKVFIMNIIS